MSSTRILVGRGDMTLPTYVVAMSETSQSIEAKPMIPTNSPLFTMPSASQPATSICVTVCILSMVEHLVSMRHLYGSQRQRSIRTPHAVTCNAQPRSTFITLPASNHHLLDDMQVVCLSLQKLTHFTMLRAFQVVARSCTRQLSACQKSSPSQSRALQCLSKQCLREQLCTKVCVYMVSIVTKITLPCSHGRKLHASDCMSLAVAIMPCMSKRQHT